MNSAEVLITFKGDSKDLDKSIDNVKQRLSVKDLVKADLIGSAIKGVAGKIAGITKSIAGVGTSVVKLAASGGMDRALNIEQAQFKLKGLGHDAESTQQIMDNALAAVKGTAYGLDEAATVAASAVAAGVKPGKDLERTLKLVGDSATISGRSMGEMGAIFNKVAASGKLTGQELNQLTDSGIPVLQLLGDSLGKTAGEVRDMVSAGEIGFAEFQDAIEKGMGGAALTMGQTFGGALANMKAALSRIGASVMGPLTQGLTPMMGTITNILDDILAGTTDNLDKNIKLLGKQAQSAIKNFTKALKPILKAVLPVIQELFPMIVQLIAQNMPMIISGISNGIAVLLPILVDALVQIAQALINALPVFLQALAKMLPSLITSLIQGVVKIVNALAAQLPTIIPLLVRAIIDGLLAILENIDLMIDAGIALIMGLADGIIEGLPVLIEKLPIIIQKLVSKLIELAPKLLTIGPKLIVKLATGLISSIPTLLKSIPKIITAIINGLKSGLGKIAGIGLDIVKGIGKGITSGIGWIKARIKEFVGNVKGFLKKLFKIGSPSRLMEDEIGQWIPKGIAVGISANTSAIDNSMKKVRSAMLSDFGLNSQLNSSMGLHYSPNVVVNVNNNMEVDPLGQVVSNIKTFSGGARNDYNYGKGA